MPRVTQPYKNTSAHRTRAMSTEAQFSSGMKYTNMPLGDGYCKTLVNFDIHNDGESITPRGGVTPIKSSQLATITGNTNILSAQQLYTYFTGSLFVEEYNTTDSTPYDIAIIGKLNSSGLDLATAHVYISTATSAVTAGISSSDTLVTSAPVESMHDVTIQHTNSRRSTCSVLNGVLYSVATSAGLVSHKFKWTDATKTAITWTINAVTAYSPDPSTTINLGYNMLKSNPYTFSNTATAVGDLMALGVVPYDASGNLLLSAHAGEAITFKLIYKYPNSDVTNAETYRVQIELQDNDAGTTAVPVLKWQNSSVYTPGSEIAFTCTPTVQNFSLICRLYKTSELEDQEDEWDNNTNLQTVCTKDEFYTPHCVTTLASYSILSNKSSSASNLDASTYSLKTATGMIMWQQRLVLWGVSKAKNTMWLSDINNPSYFPYPNNVEVFNDDIVACVPYLSDILVFTKSAVYRCTLAEDGLSFTTKCVQDKLNLTQSDIATVQSVLNMVYFKSDNVYYMLVPNYSINSGQYTVQLAPISRPVEQLFDNFEENVYSIVNEVYGLSPDRLNRPINKQLLSYNSYVDGNEIHNVYKFEYSKPSTPANITIAMVDVHIIYNTVLRAWYMQLISTDTSIMTPFILTSTGDTHFIKPYYKLETTSTVGSLPVLSGKVYVEELMYSNDTSADTMTIGDGLVRFYDNVQYLHTGNRDFAEDLKKRFREVQFCVNNLDRATLKFNTGFIVDDTPEVRPYEWVVDVDGNNNITVAREYSEECTTPELTEFNSWELDEDVLPDVTMYKIRYHVCGKGYNGSAQLHSFNTTKYELRHISFVYRQMWSR